MSANQNGPGKATPTPAGAAANLNAQSLNNPQYVARQYTGPQKLEIRIGLHTKFTVCELPWEPWVRSQVEIGQSYILEVGCGTGQFWLENLASIPKAAQITLTDQSAGMVQVVKDKLESKLSHASFEVANVENLPYPDESFDIVLAKHMLYHPKDVKKAISELHRVLKQGGVLIAATNGGLHMKELWDLAKSLSPNMVVPQDTTPFSLENGADLLSGFSKVELRRYDSRLDVTDPTAIADYIDSSAFQNPPSYEAVVNAATDIMQKNNGIFTIQKDSGIFIATK
jgi:SAM-dependent methyltransferase